MRYFNRISLPKLVPVLVVAIGLANLASGQSDRPASFDQQTKTLAIDENVPFGHVYDLNIASLNLGDTAEVRNYFDKLENDLVSFKVKSATVVQVQLNLRKHPRWTAHDWNKYLATLKDE
jgi:hypothetical protein